MFNLNKLLLIARFFMINTKLYKKGLWYCGYSQNNLDCSDRCHPAIAIFLNVEEKESHVQRTEMTYANRCDKKIL